MQHLLEEMELNIDNRKTFIKQLKVIIFKKGYIL